MKIKLENSENYDEGFCKYIMSRIQSSLLSSLNKNSQKLIPIDDYINAQAVFKTIFHTHISSKEILIATVFNLVITHSGTTMYIEPNPNIIAHGTHAKLVDMCRLITYGNLFIQGYPILDRIFNNVQHNIDQLYIDYVNGRI